MDSEVAPPPPEPMAPVQSEDRVTVIDALRGAALFGIITANMRGFNSPAATYFNPDLMWTAPPDRIAQLFINTFIQGKFITIFAVLFGLGFAIQMERAAARGQGRGFYIRRLMVLLLFGIVHSFGLWWGDILLTYALGGFILLLFRDRHQSILLRWGWGLYWFLMIPLAGAMIAKLAGADIPSPPTPDAAQLAETVRIYSHGSWSEIFRKRAQEWATLNGMLPLFMTQIVGLFLFGLYLWRKGVIRDIESHEIWWRKGRIIGAAVGFPASIAANILFFKYHPDPFGMSPIATGIMLLSIIGTPTLSLFYASTLVLAFQNPVWRRRLMPFSYVGRMALTNYLLQTVLCTMLYYSYGFGLFGKVGPLLGLVPTVVIYGLQVPFSKWWLSKHRYGPMEWLWRRLTYGSLDVTRAGEWTQAAQAR